MKRLVAHYIDTSDYGGAERSLLNLVEALDPDSWQSILLHPDQPGLAPLLHGVRQLGIDAITVPDMRGITRVRMLSTFRRIVRRVKPDLFHAHLNWPLACSGGILAAYQARVPAILATVQLFSPLPSALTIPLQRALVTRRVDRYIAVSTDVAGNISGKLRVSAEKISVVHNGVPVPAVIDERSLSSGGGDQPTVVTLARLERQKGLDVLIRAVAGIDGLRLIVAGEGPERGMLEELVARLGAEDRIELRGFVKDTFELLSQGDVFVLPSRNEGLPLSIVEAMHAGLPVVATAIGGTDELVIHERTGILVPVDDVAALQAAIRRVLGDADLAQRLGEQGRSVAGARFTAAHMAELVSRAYNELLGAESTTGGSAAVVPTLKTVANGANDG